VLGIESEEFCQAIDSVVPPDATHIGCILSDVCGHVAIRQPAEPKSGVTATIPRWRREGGRPSVALKHCLAEHVGIEVASVYPLERVWATQNSSTFYFSGVARTPDPVPALPNPQAIWYDGEEAIRVLKASKIAAYPKTNENSFHPCTVTGLGTGEAPPATRTQDCPTPHFDLA